MKTVWEIFCSILLFIAIFVFAIYVLPLIEVAVYGIAAIGMLLGLLFLAGVLIWKFFKWNWS